MPNYLLNPGFEDPTLAPWSTSYGASITTAFARKGVQSARIDHVGGGAQSNLGQAVNGLVNDGRLWTVSAWIRCLSGTGTLEMHTFTGSPFGGGSATNYGLLAFPDGRLKLVNSNTLISETSGHPFTTTWTQIVLTTKTSTFITVQFASPTVSAFSHDIDATCSWLVDDVAVGEAFYSELTYPENGPGEYEFARSIIDPVEGSMAKEGRGRIVKDEFGRLRDARFADEPDPTRGGRRPRRFENDGQPP